MIGRVGHCVFFRFVRSVLLRSECSVLLKNATFFSVLFSEFLATYETQKDVPFFSKERKRTQHSFLKNGKECKERNVLLQRT